MSAAAEGEMGRGECTPKRLSFSDSMSPTDTSNTVSF